MALPKKVIQRRIKSVRNTRKITKAMELVSAAKMRRASAGVVRARPYASLLRSVVGRLSETGDGTFSHPFLTGGKGGRTLLILFSADRGLAGGYNVNMLRATRDKVREIGAENIDAIAVGKRGADALLRLKVNVLAAFPALSNQPKFADITPVARLIEETFASGNYAQALLGTTIYVSGITQRPEITQLLPLTIEATQEEEKEADDYLFEPNPQQVLERMLPSVVTTTIFQALLEATASEHAARMMAMRNATDAATDMLDGLTFTFNQARQAAITQEIAELVSGMAALTK